MHGSTVRALMFAICFSVEPNLGGRQISFFYSFWFGFSVCSVGPSDDEDQQEKTLSQVYDRLPEGRSPQDILKNKDERERIGKSAHVGWTQQKAEEQTACW